MSPDIHNNSRGSSFITNCFQCGVISMVWYNGVCCIFRCFAVTDETTSVSFLPLSLRLPRSYLFLRTLPHVLQRHHCRCHQRLSQSHRFANRLSCQAIGRSNLCKICRMVRNILSCPVRREIQQRLLALHRNISYGSLQEFFVCLINRLGISNHFV